jgi:hypothetical protein
MNAVFSVSRAVQSNSESLPFVHFALPWELACMVAARTMYLGILGYIEMGLPKSIFNRCNLPLFSLGTSGDFTAPKF